MLGYCPEMWKCIMLWGHGAIYLALEDDDKAVAVFFILQAYATGAWGQWFVDAPWHGCCSISGCTQQACALVFLSTALMVRAIRFDCAS